MMRSLESLSSHRLLSAVAGVAAMLLVTASALSAAPKDKDEEGEPFTGYSVMCYVTQDAEYKLNPSGKVANEYENMVAVFRDFAFDSDGDVEPLVTGTTTVTINGKGGRSWGSSHMLLDAGGELDEPAFLFAGPLPYEGVFYGDSQGLEDLEVRYFMDAPGGLPYLPIDTLPEDFPGAPCVGFEPLYCGIGHPASELEDPEFCHAYEFGGRIVWVDPE
jgi:hypothetical protein